MRTMHIQNAINATSVDSDISSAIMDIEHLSGLSVHAKWASTTASGTIKLQLSNDRSDWVDHTTTQAINDDSKSSMLNFSDLNAKYAKILVKVSSGEITSISVHVCGKGPH